MDRDGVAAEGVDEDEIERSFGVLCDGESAVAEDDGCDAGAARAGVVDVAEQRGVLCEGDDGGVDLVEDDVVLRACVGGERAGA